MGDLNNDQVVWETNSTNPKNGLNSAYITYTNSALVDHNDWLFSPYFIVQDTSFEYRVGFSYTSKSGTAFAEKMEFYTAKANNGGAIENLLFRDTAILTNNIYTDTSFVFKFSDTGRHYFGFHMFSIGDQWDFMIDDFYFESTTPTGIIKYNKNNNITIYPNPTNSEITIIGVEKIEYIYLYSSTGKLIKTYLSNNIREKISLEEYVKGLYIISIKTKTGVINKRIIKE
jgi:hypothetical protein